VDCKYWYKYLVLVPGNEANDHCAVDRLADLDGRKILKREGGVDAFGVEGPKTRFRRFDATIEGDCFLTINAASSAISFEADLIRFWQVEAT